MEEKTKKCKHCKSEIPAEAKVCPQCRKKQGGGKLKWIAIIIVILAVIGAVAGGGGKSDEPKKVDNSSTPDSTPAETPEEPIVFGVGDTAEQKGVQITLSNAVESAGSEFITPDDGNIFLILEFEISNNSDSDISISSIANFEAYCDDYSVTQDILGLQAPEAEGKNQLDGSVASGKKMNGVISYQVPASYTKFEVSVSPDFWSSNDIKFVITK